ncbi:MAG: YHS domain-containing protein [Acidobacteria bacterium]|nr:YHS domain-containing protein [Acidobacteriota bacterium]
MTRFLLFLLFLILLRFILSRIFGAPRVIRSGWRSTYRRGPTRTIEGKTFKDPQCGIYVAQNLAVPLRHKGETLYFCSDQCKEAFSRSEKN